MSWLSRAVSIAVTIVVVAATALLVRSKVPTTHVGGAFRSYALFRDASRLAVGSPVMIAGVRIGEVSQLSLEGAFARVDMRLKDRVDIADDSWIVKKAESAFGDSYLEIIPGSDTGSAGVRKLKNGDQIVHVLEGGSTDQVLRAIARAMPRVDRGLNTVHDFALEGRKWSSGSLRETIVDADRWVSEGRIEKPIEAAARAMARFEGGTTRAGDAIATAKPEVGRTFDRVESGVASARRQMKDIKMSVRDGFANAREGMDRVDPTLDQLQDVVVAVNEGRRDDFAGHFGHLVNDPQLGASLDEGTEDVRNAAARLDPFKSWLGIRTEWNFLAHTPRFYVTAELRGRNDKFYVIEGSKSTQGALAEDHLTEVMAAQAYHRDQHISEGYRFTAQIGKRLGAVQFRGGVKESTAGIGADVLLGHGSLRFSVDAFGGFSYTPRVKIAGALEVFHSVYILGGVDDVLNQPHELSIATGNSNVPGYFTHLRYGRDYFLGATIQFTEADLTILARIYGAMLAGLAL